MSLIFPYIGCAGWNLTQDMQLNFPDTGSHLERYARIFPAVEINSSFYRNHLAKTYDRWADSVPSSFRFSVKIPQTITHRSRLINTEILLDEFIAGVSRLGEKLGCLLIQLPPSLVFEQKIVVSFLTALRKRYEGRLALEPRHLSWFSNEVNELLIGYLVSRVAADPAIVKKDNERFGWPGFVYYRWHGSPDMYVSRYDLAELKCLADNVYENWKNEKTVWCIFDNTAQGAAGVNALQLMEIFNDRNSLRVINKGGVTE